MKLTKKVCVLKLNKIIYLNTNSEYIYHHDIDKYSVQVKQQGNFLKQTLQIVKCSVLQCNKVQYSAVRLKCIVLCILEIPGILSLEVDMDSRITFRDWLELY